MQSATNRPLVEAPVIADRLGVQPWRVYELVRQGKIPHTRLGRQVRFDADAIEAWIARGGTGPEGA